MSRILMISSNTFAYPYPVYPLGMSMVSRDLSEKGHNVRQFDFFAEEGSEQKLKDILRSYSPDYTGISIRNIDDVDSLSSESGVLNNERRIVEIIRECSNAPIIAGGSALSILPLEILEYIGADYGIVGRGEDQFPELIETLEKGEFHPRLKNDRNPDFKSPESTCPMWDKELVDFYIARSGMLNLQTKTGCPYKCSYCVYPSLEGSRFRFRETSAVINDLETACRLYDVDTFFFTDSIFNDPGGYYLDLAEKIIKSGLKIRWAGYFRPKGIGLKELLLLKRSGLYAVEVGSDAGCDETLSAMGKGFSFSDILRFYNDCRQAEIAGAYFFIFGGPSENNRTLDEGLNNIRKLEEGVIFVYSGIRILPGTKLYERALTENILTAGDPLLEPVYYFSPGMDIEDMNNKIIHEAKRNRRYIFPPEKGKMMVDAMRAFGRKGLLWDELLSFSSISKRRRN